MPRARWSSSIPNLDPRHIPILVLLPGSRPAVFCFRPTLLLGSLSACPRSRQSPVSSTAHAWARRRHERFVDRAIHLWSRQICPGCGSQVWTRTARRVGSCAKVYGWYSSTHVLFCTVQCPPSEPYQGLGQATHGSGGHPAPNPLSCLFRASQCRVQGVPRDYEQRHSLRDTSYPREATYRVQARVVLQYDVCEVVHDAAGYVAQ